MKKVISLVLSLAMLLSIVSVVDFSAYADVQTGKLGDNITYSLDTSTGVLTISGTGKMTDYYSVYDSPFYSSYIKSVIIENGVTSIGQMVFNWCTCLTDITIPNSVTSIGQMAFNGCTNLTDITIPNSVTSIGNYAFFNCESLKSVIIPNGVKSIGNYAFNGCKSLTSITIPNSVISIGDCAFDNCTSLKFVDYNGTKSQWEKIEFGTSNNNLTNAIIKCSNGIIGNSNIFTIDNFKYQLNDDYTVSLVGYIGTPVNLVFPETVSYAGYKLKVASVGQSAFKGCTSLKNVIICNNVSSISSSAFEDCTNLTGVTIANSVKSIGNYVFYNCTSLTNITIPSSVTGIGSRVFYNCTNLAKVDYNGTVSQLKSINGYSNVSKIIKCTDGIIGNGNDVTIDNIKYQLNNDNAAGIVGYVNILDDLKIPESFIYEGYTINVTSIGDSAFKDCASLTSVAIPNSITEIGKDVFNNCTSLAKVDYNGTISQWKSISGYNNVSKIIKCIDGVIGNRNTITIDNLKYQLNNDQTASLVGYTGSFENLVIPEKISYEGYTFNVASIGDSAFKDCSSLTSVVIPNSITEIGKDAFYNCTNLAKVDYNGTVSQWKSISGYNNVSKIIKCTDGVIGNRNIVIIDNLKYQLNNDNTAYIFSYVNKTKTFEIPESVTYEGYSFNVTSISSQAFYGCASLTSITIPNSVTSIGDSAFYNCSDLKFVIYNGKKTRWNAISISNSNNSYLTGAIIKCTDGIIGNGNTVTIDNLKYQLNNDQTASLVGYTASLENLMIPEKISYEGYTFNVTSIGDKAFYKCTSLTSVTIPKSITTIGSLVFGFAGLQSVNYNGTKAEWKSITGSGNINLVIKCTDGIYANSNNALVDGIKYTLEDDYTAMVSAYYGDSQNIIIPESIEYVGCTFKVMYIAPSAFKDCTSLTSVTIPNSVESIGDNAFQNCTSLTSITIPDSVISIASYVFNGCSKLKKIEIPDSVTYIGSKAFDGTAFYNTVKNWENGVLYCGNHLISAKSDVTKITVKASTVSIAVGALDNCKSLDKINVLNPKCVINCTIPKTAVIGGAEGSTAEDYAQKNNMSIDYFEECTHSDKVQVVIAATCTEQGTVQSRCADCDKLISQTFTAPLGHTMVITTPAKAPTCTENGYTQAGYCTVCGYNEASTVIPAAGHNFGSNSPNCLVCGVANPNYAAPTPTPTQTQPTTAPTTEAKPVAKPKSASIKKVKGAKKAIAVEWKKVSGVSGYEIQAATDKKFKKNKKNVTVKKQKTTKVTIKKLKAKKKYYVRIRTYKTVNGKKVYSSWSKVKTIKTK